MAERLKGLDLDDVPAEVIVLGLPRGGVPVAYEVAAALEAPLDVIVVRKLGVPFQPELAMGAIGEGGARVISGDVVEMTGVSPSELAEVEAREQVELERRVRRFRRDRPRIELEGRTALIVDDGIATGSTARAACQVARQQGATKVVLAVPVAPVEAADRMADSVDEFIVLNTPGLFHGVGQFYRDFTQTTDETVIKLLDIAAARSIEPGSAVHAPTTSHRGDVVVTCGSVTLAGYLEIPEEAKGVVVFAHGSGSSRHSSRNRQVASVLNRAGMATLLFDLLTEAEASNRTNVFDVELLATRLTEVREWLRDDPAIAELPTGYFGASTGAAAALAAAAQPGSDIAAVVSRGGRPDLAGSRLELVTAPTRLIVGGRDSVVLELNRDAQAQLCCENDLVIVPGATHLFEEPGTLDQAAQLALEWFTKYF